MTSPEIAPKLVMAKLKIVVNVVLAGLLVWVLISHQQTMRKNIPGRDSTIYWASAKLLVHGQNPYSSPDVLRLEQGEGYTAAKPKMLRPPPWSTWMILPLGLTDAYWAWVAWLTLLFASLVVSTRLCWRMYGDPTKNPPAAFLLAAYIFAPVAACLVLAQMGLMLAVGVILFLLLAEDDPFKAGMALLLPMAKPHIFGALWPILLLWVIARKKWAVLEAALLVFLAANLIAVAFDPLIFQHYHAMIGQEGLQNEFIPTLSGMIRGVFFRQRFWVQFVPFTLGLVISLWYYRKHREEWNWPEHGPWVLVIAMLTTPYSWMQDETVLLPAILQGAVWLSRERLKARSQLAIISFGCLNVLLLLILRAAVDPYTGIYFWSTLVWFGWYWFATSVKKSEGSAAGCRRAHSDAEALAPGVS